MKADDLLLYLNSSHLTEEERKVAGKSASRLERKGALDWVDEMVGKDPIVAVGWCHVS